MLSIDPTARRSHVAGLTLHTINLPFPVGSADELVAAVAAQMDAIMSELPSDARLALVMMDGIVSVTAQVLPLHRLCALMRKHGARYICVDGAHCPGSVPLSLRTLDADFFVGNLHKWCFAPSSVAALYVRDASIMARMHAFPISHHYPQGLVSECGMLGTRDYSAFCAAYDAMIYFSRRGGEHLRKYTHDLAKAAATILARAFGTAEVSSDDLSAGMRIVQLPATLGSTMYDAEQLRIRLRQLHSIETQQAFCHAGTLFLRISAAEYSTLQDFEALRDAILSLAAPQ